jgi:3-methyl-2-oxobutanoate hydroxymethyltransferase
MGLKTVPAEPAAARRLLPGDLARMKRAGERIAMVTAYDAPGARIAESAGVDALLVGDSAAMTVLGHESTVHVTVEEMLMLTRAVTRVVRRPLVVADMPFGSFQISDAIAVRQAIRFIKDAGAAAVKLEGAGRTLDRIAAIVAAGIPVMGHVGLTPQTAVALGGYKPQGRTAVDAHRLRDDAQALERAGCFAIVVEAVPAPVAARITEELTVPTIGIGAGRACDGQVLVWHDLLGLTSGHVPSFVKRYADLAETARGAIEAYVADVRAGRFPEPRHTYAMSDEELERFRSDLDLPASTRPVPPE